MDLEQKSNINKRTLRNTGASKKRFLSQVETFNEGSRKKLEHQQTAPEENQRIKKRCPRKIKAPGTVPEEHKIIKHASLAESKH